jgi:hypothetical protein
MDVSKDVQPRAEYSDARGQRATARRCAFLGEIQDAVRRPVRETGFKCRRLCVSRVMDRAWYLQNVGLREG